MRVTLEDIDLLSEEEFLEAEKKIEKLISVWEVKNLRGRAAIFHDDQHIGIIVALEDFSEGAVFVGGEWDASSVHTFICNFNIGFAVQNSCPTLIFCKPARSPETRVEPVCVGIPVTYNFHGSLLSRVVDYSLRQIALSDKT